MKKTLLIAAAAALSLSLSSVVSAGGIEKAERYTAPLEQNVVEMDVSNVEMGQEIALSELGFGLGSNAEVQNLSATSPDYFAQEIGLYLIRQYCSAGFNDNWCRFWSSRTR